MGCDGAGSMNAPQPGTPLPWSLDVHREQTGFRMVKTYVKESGEDGEFLAHVLSTREAAEDANAAYIVHACNNYPQAQALADALRDAIHEVAAVERCVSNAATGREMRDQIGKWAIALAAWDAKP
jgi:hypothetical protein